MRNSRIALQTFLSQFVSVVSGNLIAPEQKKPYMHLHYIENGFSEPTLQSAILYVDGSNNTVQAESIAEQIGDAIGVGGVKLSLDNGYMTIYKGSPWAQHYPQPIEDNVFAIYMNFEIRIYKI